MRIELTVSSFAAYASRAALVVVSVAADIHLDFNQVVLDQGGHPCTSINLPSLSHSLPAMRLAYHLATPCFAHLHQSRHLRRPVLLHPRYFNASCSRSSHYQTLGIPKGATKNQVKVCHPSATRHILVADRV